MDAFDDRYTNGQVIVTPGAPGVALVTLWRKRDQIAKPLPPRSVAVIGNLYSCSEGLEKLVRSLLANPWIHTLIVLTSIRDLSGSFNALVSFFDNGVSAGQDTLGRERLIVNGDGNATLSPLLPIEALNRLRHRLRVVIVESTDKLTPAVTAHAKPPANHRSVEPELYQLDPPVEFDYWPGSVNGHVVRGATVAEVWLELIRRIMRYGQAAANANYGTNTRELIAATSVIDGEDPHAPFLPNWLNLGDQTLDQERIDQYVTGLVTGQPEPGASYTYGQRMAEHNQIEGLIDKLTDDPTQRGALICLWQPAVDLRGNGSPPCLITVWCRLIKTGADQATLHLAATFRSHDVAKAYPLNLFGLIGLQDHICRELSQRLNWQVSRGPVTCTSLSAHIYKQDWDLAQLTVDTHAAPIRPGTDPNGNYRVDGSGPSLILTQLDPDNGNVPLREWTGTANELIKTVVEEGLTSQPSHLAWLVAELVRLSVR